MEQTMEKAQMLNVPVIVVHCSSFMRKELQSEKEIEKI